MKPTRPAAITTASEKPVRRARAETVGKPDAQVAIPAPRERICLLVLGSHRSGTSALTRLLGLMGAALPRRLMGGGEGNETGHWEGARLVEYHDQLLAEYGSSWNDWRRLHLERLPVARRLQMKADIGAILRDDFGDRPLIVIKDPRISRFAGFFIDCLQEAGYRVVPVLAFRNPLEVIDSLQKRTVYWPGSKTRTDAALLWLSHLQESEAATRQLPRAIVRYDHLLSNWRAQISKIERVGSFRFPYGAEEVAEQVEEFLDPGRRHQSYPAGDVLLDADLQGWVSDFHEAFLRLESSGESKPTLAQLDALAQQFREAEPLLARLSEDRGSLFAQTETLRHDLETRSAALSQLESDVAAQSALLASLKSERDAQEARSNELQAQLSGAARDHSQRFSDALSKLDAMQQDLSNRQEQVERLRAELEAYRHRLADLQEQNRQIEMRYTQGMAELQDARAEASNLQAQVATVRLDEVQALQADLAAQTTQLAVLEAQWRQTEEQAATEAQDLRAELDQARQAAQEAAQQRDAVRSLAEARAVQLEVLSGQFAQLQKRVFDLDAGQVQAKAHGQALEQEIDRLRADLQAMAQTNDAQSGEIGRLVGERDEAQKLAARLQSGAREMVGMLNQARAEAYRTHTDFRNSTSWKMTAPLRWMRSRGRNETPPTAPAPLDFEGFFGPATRYLPPPGTAAGVVAGNDIVFFTICSRNFMAFARTLHRSLIRFYPHARFVVALCDDPQDHPPFVAQNEPFEFVHLDDLAIPDWRDMSRRYNVTEFNTAIKPFVFLHLFEKKGADFVVYFDPDIYVVDHLVEIEEAFGAGADVILTPHMLEPNERAEMNERRLLQYGIYNLGFVGVARTAKSLEVMRWWGRRLEHECIIKRDEGLFVDQKWADHFPAFFAHPCILHHPGYNIAYWNLSNRKVHWSGESWVVNGQPVRFVHFSGNNLDDPQVLSRHSGEHRADTIGQLKELLDEYRDQVFGNGHREFRAIPYAFNWDGASGFNEHTPRPAHQMAQPTESAPPARGPDTADVAPPARQVSGGDIIRTAMGMAGGPGKLLSKTAKAISSGDLGRLRRGLELARSTASARADFLHKTEGQPLPAQIDWQPYRKRVLMVEWKTPRPDADSGSRTVFYTIEALALLGYAVTFLPTNLMNDGPYTEALERIGVRSIDVLSYPSVRAFLEAEGADFDFVMLNRVSVVAPYLAQIRAQCPQAKLIFNTVDLHYVRELRDAELNGLPTGPAQETKASELQIVRECDLTIVLSHTEEGILRAEVPEADIEVMPLVFSELDLDPPGFDARSDILFIGSFPHKPNVDAVLYFANDIFPALRQRLPGLRFHIVGSEPTPEVLDLASRPGIVVHGFVEDIAPLFRTVRLSVAPLRYGAGIKGKIATSLAFGVPVICTPIAAEGMRIESGKHVVVAETVADWVEAIAALHGNGAEWARVSAQARQVAVEEFSLAANTMRVGAMMARLDPNLHDDTFLRFSTQEEFIRYHSVRTDEIQARQQIEKALLPASEGAFDIDGFCAVCGTRSSFTTSYMYAAGSYPDGTRSPNWREHLACTRCGFTMRLRAAMQLFLSRVYRGAGSSVYITEQTTPLFRWLNELHPGIIGSEYLGDACALGAEKDGLRNEDLTRLTFAAKSFDTILSFDVLEHVADDLAAFRECFRCLKPGGTLFFTAPFAYDKAKKVVRARLLAGGEIEHLMEPEYHGNPVDPDGALCFRYFGWDVVSDLRSVGFESVEVMNYWSRDFAYLGNFGFVIVARKGL